MLAVGLGRGGAGHGDWTVWCVGLALWLVSWATLTASVVTGLHVWSSTRKPTWWTVPGALLWIAATVLGTWGLRG